MSSLWKRIFGNRSSNKPHLREPDQTSESGWNIDSRPNHSERFTEMNRALAQEIFASRDAKRNAYFLIAGLLNQQMALMQAAQILDAKGEAYLRTPFAVGYIFGLAAWSSDNYKVARPSADADELVVLAYREVLGPLSAENISQLSGSASKWPEFHDGIEYGASDAMQVAQRTIGGATSLAEYIAKCRSNQTSDWKN